MVYLSIVEHVLFLRLCDFLLKHISFSAYLPTCSMTDDPSPSMFSLSLWLCGFLLKVYCIICVEIFSYKILYPFFSMMIVTYYQACSVFEVPWKWTALKHDRYQITLDIFVWQDSICLFSQNLISRNLYFHKFDLSFVVIYLHVFEFKICSGYSVAIQHHTMHIFSREANHNTGGGGGGWLTPVLFLSVAVVFLFLMILSLTIGLFVTHRRLLTQKDQSIAGLYSDFFFNADCENNHSHNNCFLYSQWDILSCLKAPRRNGNYFSFPPSIFIASIEKQKA